MDFSQFQAKNIPFNMRIRDVFVGVKLVQCSTHEKSKKIPIDLITNKPANINDFNGVSFEMALNAFSKGFYGGIGFVIRKSDPYVFIDLDDVRDPKTGKVDLWAVTLIRFFGSYTEISQSGRGFHIIIEGKLPPDSVHRYRSIEIYDSSRYVMLTGSFPEFFQMPKIHFKQWRLDILQFLMRNRSRRSKAGDNAFLPSAQNLLDDGDVISSAMRSRIADRFRKLYFKGDLSAYGGDHSAADMALLNWFAFWTGRDPVQMERLFSTSALGKRDKWLKRADYRERSIRRAVNDCRNVYNPDSTED